MSKLTTLFISGVLMMTMTSAVLANDAVKTVKEFYSFADARPMDAAKVRSFFAENFKDHDSTEKGPHIDKSVGTYAALAEGSPDSQHELSMVLPSGEDKAIVYWRYTGTNTHNLFGMPTTKPARSFDIAGIEIFQIKDGKITDMWHVEEINKLVETLTGDQ